MTEHDERPQDDASQDTPEAAAAEAADAEETFEASAAQDDAPEADAPEADAPEADADAASPPAAQDAEDDEIAFLDDDEEPDKVFVAPNELDKLTADLEAANQARASAEDEARQFKERLMRKAAELENFRKRSTRERDEAVQRAREKVIVEMLPVADNLERALQHAPEEADSSLVDGVKMVLRQFQNQLQKFDVQGFDSVGEPFNPERHEAVMQRPSPDHPNNTVVEEYQRGYTIGERLLRPAMVVVAKN